MRKGEKMSEEQKRKLSISLKARPNGNGLCGSHRSEETKRKLREINLGKKHNISEETRKIFSDNAKKNISGWNKGKKMPSLVGNTNGFKKGFTPWNKGLKKVISEEKKVKLEDLRKKRKLETRLKRREHWLGKNNPNYVDGTSKASGIHYFDLQWKLWREEVFKRDNYTCQHCFIKGGKFLEPHHIKGWAQYPELRYEISNGLTLCKECHKLTDNYMGKGKRKIITNL